MALPNIDLTVNESLQELRSIVSGNVYAPGDVEYETARLAWNRSFEHRPAVIVVAASDQDVAAAVRYARDAGLGVAVQATGHGVIRTAEGAMLIVTAEMNAVSVDAHTRTALVQAGAEWGAVLEKAHALGLAPLLGSSPNVGAVGYTLGGGMGWLVRKYGLSADSVLFFDVVTADGRLLRASETENSDLFWALRGGGGSFGIVTRMAIRLYPVTAVYGGGLIYPADQAKAVFSYYREWINTLPVEWTTSIALFNFPPFPEVPEFLRGQSVVMVRGCYSGNVEDGAAALQGWRERFTPVADTFHPMPFGEVASISNDPLDPMPAFSTGAWLKDLTDDAIETLIRYMFVQAGPPPLAFAEVRHVSGALNQVDPLQNAFGHRDATLILSIVGASPTPEVRQQLVHYTDALKTELEPVLTGKVYMNFVEGGEAFRRTQDGYTAEKYARLQAIKAQYDPDNVFNFGYNIPPASGQKA